MVQPNTDGAYQYFVHYDFDRVQMVDTAISDTEALGISLIAEQQFPSGIIPEVPFFTVFEGVLVINGDASNGAAYEVELDFLHKIPDQGEFTSHRSVVTRIGSNQWDSVAMSDFNSVSFIPDGPWADPSDDSNTFEFDRQLTEYTGIVGEMALSIRAFQNNGATRIARTPQLISLENAGVSFYQLKTQMRRGRDYSC